MIVDIIVPHEENLVKAENDKQNIKYLDLANEIFDMWDVAVVDYFMISLKKIRVKAIVFIFHPIKRIANPTIV